MNCEYGILNGRSCVVQKVNQSPKDNLLVPRIDNVLTYSAKVPELQPVAFNDVNDRFKTIWAPPYNKPFKPSARGRHAARLRKRRAGSQDAVPYRPGTLAVLPA
jgi:hypothetical protein